MRTDSTRMAPAGGVFAAFLALLLLGGCGYTLSASPALPGGIETVIVPVLENNTSEMEVGVVMAAALARRAEGEGRLASSRDAQGRLVGRVEQIRASPVAFPAASGGAGMYALTLRVRLRLVPAAGGRPISDFVVSGREQYLAGKSPEETEANRRLAMERLCDLLADEAWGRLTAPR